MRPEFVGMHVEGSTHIQRVVVTAAVGAGVVTGVGIAAWVGVGGADSVTVTTAPGAFLRNRLQPDSTPTISARIRNRLKIRTEFFTISSFFPDSAGGSAAVRGISFSI